MLASAPPAVRAQYPSWKLYRVAQHLKGSLWQMQPRGFSKGRQMKILTMAAPPPPVEETEPSGGQDSTPGWIRQRRTASSRAAHKDPHWGRRHQQGNRALWQVYKWGTKPRLPWRPYRLVSRPGLTPPLPTLPPSAERPTRHSKASPDRLHGPEGRKKLPAFLNAFPREQSGAGLSPVSPKLPRD